MTGPGLSHLVPTWLARLSRIARLHGRAGPAALSRRRVSRPHAASAAARAAALAARGGRRMPRRRAPRGSPPAMRCEAIAAPARGARRSPATCRSGASSTRCRRCWRSPASATGLAVPVIEAPGQPLRVPRLDAGGGDRAPGRSASRCRSAARRSSPTCCWCRCWPSTARGPPARLRRRLLRPHDRRAARRRRGHGARLRLRRAGGAGGAGRRAPTCSSTRSSPSRGRWTAGSRAPECRLARLPARVRD